MNFLIQRCSFSASRANTFRFLSTSTLRMSLSDDFEKAKQRVSSLTQDPGNEMKLKMYALFKQSKEGKCNAPKPGMMDFVGKAKWDAWNKLGSMSKDDAMNEYINIVNELVAADPGSKEQPGSTTDASSDTQYEGLHVTNSGGVFTIRLNRPSKKNAITWEMYNSWVQALKDAANDPSVRVAAITGTGDYFCSGNDLSNFTKDLGKMSPQEMAKNGRDVLLKFVGAFIDFPKPLVGLINGPAVGISVSTLGLYDAVFSVDNATFHMPFSNLGQTPEGCSSYIFPKMMGYAKANSLIMFNKKATAQEMKDYGIVTEVFPQSTFEQETQAILKDYANLPPQTMGYAKELIRGVDKETLHQVNQKECDRLQERWPSDECANAIMAFFSRNKSKL